MKDDQDRIEIFKELFPHPPEGALLSADGLLAGMLVDPRLLSAESGLGITTRPIVRGPSPLPEAGVLPSLSLPKDGEPGGQP